MMLADCRFQPHAGCESLTLCAPNGDRRLLVAWQPWQSGDQPHDWKLPRHNAMACRSLRSKTTCIAASAYHLLSALAAAVDKSFWQFEGTTTGMVQVMSEAITKNDVPLAKTGIEGLDDILGGGFHTRRLYLVEGVPGSGKTTLALQFLLEGVKQGEPVLYVTLSETEDELRSVAASHGWSLAGISIRDAVPSEHTLQGDQQYTMFHPSEVELNETTRAILNDVEQIKPRRVVFDSLSEFRLITGSPLQYRRHISALKRFFSGRNCTVMLLDDLTANDRDLQVQSIAHGVVFLDQWYPDYGSERRRVRIVKYRGMKFRGGFHDYTIEHGGLRVFPRLVAAEHRQPSTREKLVSGIKPLDDLLGGGIECGTSSLLIGAAGTGKSTIAAQFVHAAAKRGEHAAMFIFDEGLETLLSRSEGLGISLRDHVAAKRVRIQQIDPAELAPGQFTHDIRLAVERDHARIIVIDSLNGYLNAMPGEKYLAVQLHELLMYLGQHGVATILVGAHQGLIGSAMVTPVDASYLADAVILIRYFESQGEVRQAISVMKKRGGEHERTIREFRLADGRIHVGEPLRELRGILSGIPVPESVNGQKTVLS
jgi:circadian clock protein KaiC